jgi:hypothetical protein
VRSGDPARSHCLLIAPLAPIFEQTEQFPAGLAPTRACKGLGADPRGRTTLVLTEGDTWERCLVNG